MNTDDRAIADLKPCPNPWCDPKFSTPEVLRGAGGYAVNCCGLDACGLKGPSRGSEEDAREAWNTRPADRLEAFHANAILWAREVTARYFENDPLDKARREIAQHTREGRYDDQDAVQIALYARAALQSPPPVVSGEADWAWVPRDPTPEMLAASEREWDGRMSFRSTGAWQAMLDAAPVSPEFPLGEPTPGNSFRPLAREADDHHSPTEFTTSLADRGETSATPPVVSGEATTLELARQICAQARPDYADGFLSGKYDGSSTEMRAVMIALSTPATAQGDVREVCARMADDLRHAFDMERSRTPDGDAHWYLAGKRDGALSVASAIRATLGAPHEG